jgi:3-dehydroquinate synthase
VSAEQAVTPLSLPVPYPVVVQRGALAEVGRIAAAHAPAHRYVVIADATVAAHHGRTVIAGIPGENTMVLKVPPGEQEKSRERWAQLTDAMLTAGCGRDTTVIALGGGVVGDLAGFVAATYMRGVPVVQVPTTLLAMVDASVGGKTAIDVPAGKNLVGAFHDPAAVVMDPDVLATLPAPALRGGLAEMLKHGVIADAAYWDRTVQALGGGIGDAGFTDALPRLIADSVAIKARVVAQDAREAGLRQVLNFGHTIAHAIERELDYGLAHGDAVAIGMVLEARIGEAMGIAVAGLSDRIADGVRLAGLPAELPANRGLAADALLTATAGDKKARAGTVRYSLPRDIGVMEPGQDDRWSVTVPDHIVLQILSSSLSAPRN